MLSFSVCFCLFQCDGIDISQKIRNLKPVCVLFLNIPKYSSGMTPWGHPTGNEFQVQSYEDKLIEVLAFTINQLVSFCVTAYIIFMS